MSDTHFHVSLCACFESTLIHFQSSSTAAQRRGSESLAGNQFPRRYVRPQESGLHLSPSVSASGHLRWSQETASLTPRWCWGSCWDHIWRISDLEKTSAFYRKCHFLLPYFWLLHKLAFFWGCLDHKCFRNMIAYTRIWNLHLHILGSRNSLSRSYETRGSSLCSFCHLLHPPKLGALGRKIDLVLPCYSRCSREWLQ